MAAGKWTVQQAAEMSVDAPTIEASLDGRFVSGLKDERVKAAKFYEQFGVNAPSQLVSFCLNDTATQLLREDLTGHAAQDQLQTPASMAPPMWAST